jgi:hypothetical protein
MREIIEKYAIAPKTPLNIVNKNPPCPKLVALWQMDEHSKLYCQWIPQETNSNK